MFVGGVFKTLFNIHDGVIWEKNDQLLLSVSYYFLLKYYILFQF